ncbi:hypothetical protein QBC37DRAFT_125854 [Rhypophila decipiens]|uniref:Uncharacterized protein n=1 Tax=Rhypophila decipiens TaxID=261697 RepID=A0AAN7B9H3_9PEZI|nr:hypothetical protein QBC37DRAFT_125854 [Rhypophila decipiens]
MGGYSGVATTTWETSGSYDKRYSSISSVVDPASWGQTSGSYHPHQVQQSGGYCENLYTVPQYLQETRYGQAFDDPPSYLPDLTKSPSISSASSIGTPSGRSYQDSIGSYFPPSRKNTGPDPIYEESDIRDTAGNGEDNELEQVGSAFADVSLNERYSGRLDPIPYEHSGYDMSHRKSRELAKKEKEEAIERDIDDLFDEAEEMVPANAWTDDIGPRPGIVTHFKEVKDAVSAIRESEWINKDLKGIAAKLADFRHKRRAKHRPSFSSRTSTSSSKPPPASQRDAYYDKAHKTDRDRDRKRR